MKRVLSATLLCLSLFAIGIGQHVTNAPLTNASVVQLVKAGFKEKTIITIINNRPSDFKLDTDDLINLKRNNVSENIILAMMSAQMGTFVVSDEDWEGESFLKDSKKPNAGGDSQSQGTNIFGSGGSSQSQSQTRSGSGGNQNEGNVTGSASIRIIKPPVAVVARTPHRSSRRRRH